MVKITPRARNPIMTSGRRRAKKTLVLEVWWAWLRPTKYNTIAQRGITILPRKGITLMMEVAPEA